MAAKPSPKPSPKPKPTPYKSTGDADKDLDELFRQVRTGTGVGAGIKKQGFKPVSRGEYSKAMGRQGSGGSKDLYMLQGDSSTPKPTAKKGLGGHRGK